MTPYEMRGKNENKRVASPESVPIHLNLEVYPFTLSLFLTTILAVADLVLFMLYIMPLHKVHHSQAFSRINMVNVAYQ